MNNNSQTQYSKILRLGSFFCIISGLILLSLLMLPVSYASPGTLPAAAPSPRPPLSDGKRGSDDGPSSAISGNVTDLSLRQPGQAIEVVVNGAIVRTDTAGNYSITGLNAGDYTVSLELRGQGEPAQGPVHVALDGSHNAVIDLEYYSQPSPTDTPQPTATAQTVSAANTPAALPDSGASLGHRPPGLIILGLLLLALGFVLFNQSRVKPGQQSSLQTCDD